MGDTKGLESIPDLILLFASWVTFCKSLNLSGPAFSLGEVGLRKQVKQFLHGYQTWPEHSC